jgi:hypothetical protein
VVRLSGLVSTATTVIASGSEAIQTSGLRRRLSLDRFALLAMTAEIVST